MEAYKMREYIQGMLEGGWWKMNTPLTVKDLLELVQKGLRDEQSYQDIIEKWQNDFLNKNKTEMKLEVTLSADPTLKKMLLELLSEVTNGEEEEAPKKKKKPVEEDEEEEAPKKKKKPVEEDEEEEEEAEEAEEAEEEEDEVTLETITALAKKKIAAGKSAKLKTLLDKYKAPKVANLKKTQYEKFFAELQALK
jgi:hypothetical protein